MSDTTVTVNWDRDKLSRFERAYRDYMNQKGASRDGTFQFDGHEFVAGYAKYLIEFLERRLA